MNFRIPAVLLLFTVFSSCHHPGTHTDSKAGKAKNAKIVFKSTDGGQTWQDISKGLPEDLQKDSIRGNSFFANDKGLFLKFGDAIYQSTLNSTDPSWIKTISSDEYSSIPAGNSGMANWGVNLKKTNGTNIWSPVLDNFQETRIRSAFETAGGAIFISTDGGLLKTSDNGKTWKRVHTQGMDGNMAESDGILVAISMRKLLRSTDNGENWEQMTSEDAVAWDVKAIKGGFAAISSGLESPTRRLSTSYDGGKTWQSLHSPLRNKAIVDSIWRTWDDRPRVRTFITSISQVGKDLFCTHPGGIFKSSDQGKTWKLLLPSVDDKTFNLFFSGNAIYAVSGRGGC